VVKQITPYLYSRSESNIAINRRPVATVQRLHKKRCTFYA